MSGRRKSLDGGTYGGTGKAKMQLALLKLSTANAFAKGLNASATAKSVELSATSSLSQDVAHGIQGSGGSVFFPDDSSGAADAAPPQSSPPVPRSPYYGMYADYEDVMELLHSGVVADGNAKRLFSGVSPDQLVHVAHLGIGACCSVDLVAVHCADGSRLLAAAKSCYLPPSDPRLRASLREAELLRSCADCPFIMQLLAVVQHQEPPAGGGGGAAASPNTISPVGTPPRTSLQLVGSSELTPAGSFGGGGGFGFASSGAFNGDGGTSGGGGSVANVAAMAAMVSSPGYQSWAAWRGGGAAEDLEWQLMQRLMAASGSRSGPDGLGGASGGMFCGLPTQMGSGGGGGPMRLGSMVGSVRTSLSGWDPSISTQDESPAAHDAGLGTAAAYSYNSGGGWAYGGGWAHSGGAAAAPAAPAGSRAPRLRRASMDIVDMYGGCTGLAGGWGGVDNGGAAAGAAEAGGGGAEAPVMCTLLLGWARCGDLRRLVQLLIGRSPAHQNSKQTGAPPAVSGLPPLVPEDAARFYTGCLALALEHLHANLHTVHRDLKLANLLLLDSGYAVVGDLGTAVDLTTVPGGRLTSRVGSPGHMAPECRDRDDAGYDTAADMWSVGACLFALLTGQLPAGVAGPPNRQWSPPLSRNWSAELQGLLGRLLAWSPGQRPNVAQLMRDPWFKGFNWKALREHRLQPPSNMPWRELLWWPKESPQLL